MARDDEDMQANRDEPLNRRDTEEDMDREEDTRLGEEEGTEERT